MRKKVLIIILILFMCVESGYAVTVWDINDEMDYSELDNWLGNNGISDMSFTEYVEGLLNGSEDFTAGGLLKSILASCMISLESELSVFSTIFLILGMAAIFTAFTSTVRNNQVSELGFYLTYMLIVSVLSGVYVSISGMAESLLAKVLEFMSILTPSYMMSMAFCTGGASATAMYEVSLLVITLADGILLHYVFPMIDIYLLLSISNHITRKGMFNRMAELVYSAVRWINKTLLAVVIGMSAIQGMIAPGVDELKRGVLTKASGMMPVIGNLVGGMTETVLGAGVVLKNVIGVAGVVAIVFLLTAPFVKIAVMQFVIRFSGAVVEPIIDGRLTDMITDTGKAVGLILESIVSAALLFMLVIVIMAVSTGI